MSDTKNESYRNTAPAQTESADSHRAAATYWSTTARSEENAAAVDRQKASAEIAQAEAPKPRQSQSM